MKKVLTKSFWQGVRRTFTEARQDPPVQDANSQPAAEAKPDDPAPADVPPPIDPTS